MNKSLRSLLSVVAVSSLAACSLAPVYQRPGLAAPATARRCGCKAGVVRLAPAVAEVPWKQYFPDARLQGLIRQALDSNRDLRVAVLNRISCVRRIKFKTPIASPH